MKLTAIRASNFVSFGIGDQGLQLDGLHGLTILVGPNGAGKTNVLRVVEAVVDALRPTPGVSGHPQDPSAQVNRLAADVAPIHLELSVEFDAVREQETLLSFWLNAMAYPEASSLNFTIQEDGKQRGFQPNWDRLRSFAAYVEEHVTMDDVRPLFKGRIVFDVDLPSRYPATTVAYECMVGGVRAVVGLLGRNMADGGIRFLGGAPPGGGRSAISSLVGALDPAVHQQLARYLEGRGVAQPDLPPFGLKRLATVTASPPGWFTTALADQDQYSLYSGDRPPAARTRLNRLMDRHPADGERLHLGHVLGHLVRNAVICCFDWDVDTEEDLQNDTGGSTGALLADRHLALYLLRLKNGDLDERRLFAAIRDDFQRLTGTCLDVHRRVMPGQPTAVVAPALPLSRVRRIGGQLLPQQPAPPPPEQTAVVTTDHEIPLAYAGSGRAQVALVIALSHHHASRVLLLDEPEIHLHPALARELASRLKKRRDQTVVATQSPYMIPPGALSVVRRLVALPGAPSSASPAIDAATVRRHSLRKRPVQPEDAMFLFSWCTVFVEGLNEAYALPVWFDKWAAKHRLGSQAGERLGVRFQAVGGAKAILPWLRIARLFRVPALGLYDADVLSNKAAKRSDNRQIVEQWREEGWISGDAREILGDAAWLAAIHDACPQVFFCGTTTDMELEKLAICSKNEKEAVAATGGGPLAYRYIAERHPAPDELVAVLESAARTAVTARSVAS